MDSDDDEAKASRNLLNAGLTAVGLAACAASAFIGGGLAVAGAVIGGACLLGSVASALFPPEDAFERSCRECEQRPVAGDAEPPAIGQQPAQAQEQGQRWRQTVDAGRKACRSR